MGNNCGTCLGIKSKRPGENPRFLGSKLVEIDANPFGPAAGSARQQMGRGRANSYFNNGSVPYNGRAPLPKLMRQTSALSGNPHHMPYPQPSPSTQVVPKLVDIDDNVTTQNSHAICNRKQSTNGALDVGPQSGDINNPSEYKTFLALFDYDPRTHEDLAFRKGDHLETTLSHMVGDWWLVRSKATNKIGYIPSNYVVELETISAEAWYFGKIGRPEAEARLRRPENKDGAFIIRKGDTRDNMFSLSLKHNNEVKHYRIIRDEIRNGFFINRIKIFPKLEDLVQFHSNKAEGLCIALGEPCKRDAPTTNGLSYDTHDKWEIDRREIKLLHELGRGQFGQVYQGLFKGKISVAVKTLRKGSMDPQDFLAEAQIMKKMKNENLVQLYAVCTKEEPVYIITELMSKGALINYLQTSEGKDLKLHTYIHMAAQIASGMAYLEHEKYVHRDLAARNILVGENQVCKIADFGLARFIKETEYEARVGARFPIKWTAPEAANFSKFTIKSDVWSFGIVLYEIITKGGIPYPEMTNAEVLSRIDKGYRMPQPPNCEAKYYSIMLECWHKDHIKRPTFQTLEWKLTDYFLLDEQYKEASQFRERQGDKNHL